MPTVAVTLRIGHVDGPGEGLTHYLHEAYMGQDPIYTTYKKILWHLGRYGREHGASQEECLHDRIWVESLHWPSDGGIMELHFSG